MSQLHEEALQLQQAVVNPMGIAVIASPGGSPTEETIDDEYIFQLLSMVSSLTSSLHGVAVVVQSGKSVIADLLTLLACGTPRAQRQTLFVLRRLLPASSPTAAAENLPVVGRHNGVGAGIVPSLLSLLASTVTLQLRTKGQAKQSVTVSALDACGALFVAKPKAPLDAEIAKGIIDLLNLLGASEDDPSVHDGWTQAVSARLNELVMHFHDYASTEIDPGAIVSEPKFWLAVSALCALTPALREHLEIAGADAQSNFCDNHDDGVTEATVECTGGPFSGMKLCHSCDKVLHLAPGMQDHVRTEIESENGGLQLEVHDGSTRVKLRQLVSIADRTLLKAVVEVKTEAKGAVCRFCESDLGDAGPLANLSKCGLVGVCDDCVEVAEQTCTKTLPCGHLCDGVRGEVVCLPCIHPGCTAHKESRAKMDREDECMCYTGSLSEEPCIMLECGHVLHYNRAVRILKGKWNGPRIDFGFANCPNCRADLLNTAPHPALAELIAPIQELYDEVKRKSIMRWQYDGGKITGTGEKEAGAAMKKYAYYMCHKCDSPYFGGEYACAAAAGDEYDPTELVCGACIGGAPAQICPKHGTDFLEYKCRFCCSVAVFFCFGTTHFCTPCHDAHSRCVAESKDAMPQCPVGPVFKELEGDECPLHVVHPPTGEEFCLGCGVCRNAQTF